MDGWIDGWMEGWESVWQNQQSESGDVMHGLWSGAGKYSNNDQALKLLGTHCSTFNLCVIKPTRTFCYYWCYIVTMISKIKAIKLYNNWRVTISYWSCNSRSFQTLLGINYLFTTYIALLTYLVINETIGFLVYSWIIPFFTRSFGYRWGCNLYLTDMAPLRTLIIFILQGMSFLFLFHIQLFLNG